jgi:regulator of nonsense transcripts 1
MIAVVKQRTHTLSQVQYRFPQELAHFPSQEFYNGELISGIENPQAALRILSYSSFPWPRRNGMIVPTVFVPCGDEEDMSGRMTSKQNIGQARMVAHIVHLLRSSVERNPPLDADQAAELGALKVTVLCPYTAQRQLIENRVQRFGVSCSTVDSFQGRESDIIVFSTVRSNPSHEVGFLEDARRLNVMWTRAKKGLIIVGDAETLKEGSALWKRAVESCEPVAVVVPEQT